MLPKGEIVTPCTGPACPGTESRDKDALIAAPLVDVSGTKRRHVIRVDQVRKVGSPVAEITHLKHPVIRELVLHIRIPLLGVAVGGIRVCREASDTD